MAKNSADIGVSFMKNIEKMIKHPIQPSCTETLIWMCMLIFHNLKCKSRNLYLACDLSFQGGAGGGGRGVSDTDPKTLDHDCINQTS